MDFREVNDYLASLADHGDPVLQEMEAEARRRRFPIVGPAAGQLCYMLARAIDARNIFEMGSGYGYSTAWFAKAARDNGGGTVHHVVWDEELSAQARGYLDRMGLNECVQYTVGEAVETLRAADGPFDIVFNDINKDGYPASYEVLKAKLRPGGLAIIDNMLWRGRAWGRERQRRLYARRARHHAHDLRRPRLRLFARSDPRRADCRLEGAVSGEA